MLYNILNWYHKFNINLKSKGESMYTYYEFLSECFENNIGLKVIKEYVNYCRKNQSKRIFDSKFIEQIEDPHIRQLTRTPIEEYINAYKKNKVECKITDRDYMTLVLSLFPSSINNKYKKWKAKEFLEFVKQFKIVYEDEHLEVEDINITYVQNIVSEFNSQYYFINENEKYNTDSSNKICGISVENPIILWKVEKESKLGTFNMYTNYTLTGLDLYGNERISIKRKLQVPGLEFKENTITESRLIVEKEAVEKVNNEIVYFNNNHDDQYIEYYNILLPSPISVRVINLLRNNEKIKCKLFTSKLYNETSDRNMKRIYSKINKFIQ